jgi:hypothetical protein
MAAVAADAGTQCCSACLLACLPQLLMVTPTAALPTCLPQVFSAEGLIYMVLEYGDIDLARLLANHEQARKQGGGGDQMDENFIRLYWQQMLQVGTC